MAICAEAGKSFLKYVVYVQAFLLLNTIVNAVFYAIVAAKLKSFLNDHFNNRFDKHLYPILRLSKFLLYAALVQVADQLLTMWWVSKTPEMVDRPLLR